MHVCAYVYLPILFSSVNVFQISPTPSVKESSPKSHVNGKRAINVSPTAPTDTV